jgi:hypothetical protein
MPAIKTTAPLLDYSKAMLARTENRHKLRKILVFLSQSGNGAALERQKHESYSPALVRQDFFQTASLRALRERL